MSKNDEIFIIVGAGQAGAWVARTLRAEGFAGRIILIGDENHWPYERPQLSKGFLTGDVTSESITLMTPGFAASEHIDFRPNVTVEKINRSAHLLTLADGYELSYTKLFLTTGGSPRVLPILGGHSDRAHVLRTQDDSIRLRASLDISQHLLIVGGGWIGLEAAATARKRGAKVTILEAGTRLCKRSVPHVVSDYLLRLHQSNGVVVESSVEVVELHTHESGITAYLGNGKVIEADRLLAGIGITPNTRLGEECGLLVRNGIVVDDQGRTSDTDIFAAGDVAKHPNRFAGEEVRLESWSNAQAQAICAARSALGKDAHYDEVPWFWSDQYDANLQCLGMPHRASYSVARGCPDSGEGCWLFLTPDDQLVGAVAINAPREMRFLRKAVAAGSMPAPAAWADGTESLQTMPMITTQRQMAVTPAVPVN
nr:FAD-dependent oxidoreductase [uncultured Pseudomonas sp.]